MTREQAENIITAYAKPIYGFALQRCRSREDAEDLAQDIALRAFRALCAKDDVRDPEKFLWTTAHHTLANYYRSTARAYIGVPIDGMADALADPDDPYAAIGDDSAASIRRLRQEIAYLSETQRRIVIAYYFENRKQAEIARAMNLPIGTVKWHLFEAKKELKRGMDTMRNTSELTFNPIRFDTIGFNGSVGKQHTGDFLHSALSQNICYAAYRAPKTTAQLAEDLGVSPVYIESEISFLEEYGFLTAEKGGWRTNFIISEPTEDLLRMQDAMYKKAAALFAPALYDALIASGLLDDPALKTAQKTDKNFLLWALIPYIAAWAGDDDGENPISFEEVATMRPDGGHNIVHATVFTKEPALPDDYVYMKNWNGPMWNGNGGWIFWQVDTAWSRRPSALDRVFPNECEQAITLWNREKDGTLSKYDAAWLVERGYATVTPEGTLDWQIVIIDDPALLDKLIALGDAVRKICADAFDALRKPYADAVLSALPPHVRKMRAYELQFLFCSDGWFLLHCLTCLLQKGLLYAPTDAQRVILTTLLVKRK